MDWMIDMIGSETLQAPQYSRISGGFTACSAPSCSFASSLAPTTSSDTNIVELLKANSLQQGKKAESNIYSGLDCL